MKVSLSVLNVPGIKTDGENPLPMFHDRSQDKKPNLIETCEWSEELLKDFGKNVGFRVLPYRMQDRYNRDLVLSVYKLIILENEYLKASFLPGFGGKLYSLVDKRSQRELLFSNPVLRLGNIAIRNAWLSGGIEWNIGIVGHTFFGCSNVFCALLKDDNGNEFVRIYEFERMKRLYWQVDFHLPSGEEMLFAHGRVINPNDHDVDMYWWTDMAIPESAGLRVLSDSDRLLYIEPTGERYVRDPKEGKPSPYKFGYGSYEETCRRFGFDVSFPHNFTNADDYFFHAKPDDPAPWIAATYEDGFTFFNCSTPRLCSRKMYTWGNHAGARRWCDHLSVKGQGNFAEIQSGMAYSQNHTVPMPARTEWEWTECFSSLQIDGRDTILKGPFSEAVDQVKKYITQKITPQALAAWDKTFSLLAVREPEKMLHNGSGYGALQRMAVLQADPDGLPFPDSTVGEEQLPWLNLLEKGCFPEYDRNMRIPSWMAGDPVWMTLLKKSITGPSANNAAARLAMGVMLYENGQYVEAQREFITSAELIPNPLAFRCLACCRQAEDDIEGAVVWMEKAIALDDGSLDQGYWEEYLSILLYAGKYHDVWRLYNALPPEKRNDRIALYAGHAALHIGQEDFVLSLFDRDLQCLREGDTDLSDMFYGYHTVKEAARLGVPVSEALNEKLRMTLPLPENIDYRIVP